MVGIGVVELCDVVVGFLGVYLCYDGVELGLDVGM